MQVEQGCWTEADGEIPPHAASGMCELHNQTMTITVLAET